MKNISILGSTGSIGRSALEVVSRNRDRFNVVALTANRNHDLLLKQIEDFMPSMVAVTDREAARELRTKVRIPVLTGTEGLCEAASLGEVDFVLSAIVGFAGLEPTLAAVRAGKTVGLANKESLVTAGAFLTSKAESSGAVILPVDSEHSAVFQCLDRSENSNSPRRIILTASGGPFVSKSREDLCKVGPSDALSHPNWEMGKKITIDSSTLMNKGLEVIEAHFLFGLNLESIDVVIHPQSIIHSMVEFWDGTVIAQLSRPDMKGPIAFALSYPERLDEVMKPLDFAELGSLSFGKPDTERFPCLRLAYEALGAGGSMPAVLNAANEVAVESFLNEEIGFMSIPEVVEKTMHAHRLFAIKSFEDAIGADGEARSRAMEIIKKIKGGADRCS